MKQVEFVVRQLHSIYDAHRLFDPLCLRFDLRMFSAKFAFVRVAQRMGRIFGPLCSMRIGWIANILPKFAFYGIFQH